MLKWLTCQWNKSNFFWLEIARLHILIFHLATVELCTNRTPLAYYLRDCRALYAQSSSLAHLGISIFYIPRIHCGIVWCLWSNSSSRFPEEPRSAHKVHAHGEGDYGYAHTNRSWSYPEKTTRRSVWRLHSQVCHGHLRSRGIFLVGNDLTTIHQGPKPSSSGSHSQFLTVCFHEGDTTPSW